MKATILTTALLAAGTAASSAALNAVTLFTADFTAPTYADGAASTQPGFNGAGTQAAYAISDSAGTGVLTGGTGFVRAQIGPNTLSTSTVSVGEQIIIEADNYSLFAGTNNARAIMGLSGGGGGGAAQMTIGGQLSVDGAANIYVENGAFAVDPGRVDTGLDVGATFDYAIVLTAESAGAVPSQTYTIDHLINGTSLLTEVGQSIGAAADPATYLSGFIQDQGAGAQFSMEGFTIRTVPEPSSALLMSLSGLALLARRRRS